MTNEEFFDIGRVAYITGNVQEALAAKQALETVVEKANNLQQLKAEIHAMCIELECTTHEKFNSGMYHALRGRLRELSAI
jgi:hypothetical protein